MRIIKRASYLEELASVEGTPDIKIITGIRRSGKSTLLRDFVSSVIERNPQTNLISVDFNLLDNEVLQDYHALNDYVSAHTVPGVPNMIAIDEVQMCRGFEKAVNSWHASGKYDIYLTGSNAFLLSSDLATLFTGRTYSVQVYPFSLQEFMKYFEMSDPSQALERYVQEGGMAGSYVYANEQRRSQYLADIFNTLVLRDICQRHQLRRSNALDRITDFLIDNIGNISSARKISGALTSAGMKITDKTVSQYIGYLREAFAFYRVRRYDTRGKRYLTSGDKYYLADHAFRYALLGTRNFDYGHVYENIVAIELLRRGYQLYVGTLSTRSQSESQEAGDQGAAEIDFIAVKGSEKIYIQVSDDISSPQAFQRECASLLAIRDAYPKVLLANTRHPSYDYEGIRVTDLASWISRP